MSRVAMDADDEVSHKIRLLFPKKSLLNSSPGIQWLIGSPLFLPPFTAAASFRCLHTLSHDDPFSPNLTNEADDIRALLVRGFDIVGAIIVHSLSGAGDASKALELAQRLRELVFGDEGSCHGMIGGFANAKTGNAHFMVSESSGVKVVDASDVVYGNNSKSLLWENGCLLRCELKLKFPVFVPLNETSDVQAVFTSLVESTAAKLRDDNIVFLVEGPNLSSEEPPHSVVLHGKELDFSPQAPSQKNGLACSYFCSTKKSELSSNTKQDADAIRITVLSNQSISTPMPGAPVLEYFPASAPASLLVISLKLDVLCYTKVDFPVAFAVSKLVVPGLVDQLNTMKKAILPELITHHHQLCPYHFLPPGFLIPITAIYDIRYGEVEEKQGELRKSLHLRLGLPLDRPLLRISNALTFGIKEKRERSLTRDGSPLLRDVHTEIPSSGVSGGITSLIDGSYEYYHYLHDGLDDNGWGCAYRSLQTIISWYRLQQYTSMNVPSHREIQHALVEIGDKDPSFVGSREWIGAIELSFVLDKLLGVSCKIINVRSGEELPEKCRELAMHFETQGTPVMIGGGVLAYTLLGVDYNDASGDCAFLILDPHYTGADDLKKIVNSGWCGWKKSVDAKGKSFFLKDKFYNLLLPQRPNMV